jgi:hypothetical protein
MKEIRGRTERVVQAYDGDQSTERRSGSGHWEPKIIGEPRETGFSANTLLHEKDKERASEERRKAVYAKLERKIVIEA